MDLDSLILNCDFFFMMWIPKAVCYKIRDAGNCYLCIAVKYYNPRNWQISDCFSFFRDLHDIGCFVKVIDGCQQLDKETRYRNSNTCTMGTLFRVGQEDHMPSSGFLSKILLNFRKNSLDICLPEPQFLEEMLSEYLSPWEFFKSFSEYNKLSTLTGVHCHHYLTLIFLDKVRVH